METKTAIVIFEDLPIRKIEMNGETWISALDVAKALEYKNPTQDVGTVLRRNPERFKGYAKRLPLKTPGGIQTLTFLNQKGVIAFCMLSEKPKAIPFQRWADEILEQQIQNIPTDIRIIAKKKRIEFTDTLKDHGYKTPTEYIKTTVGMKEAVGIDKNKKKSECDLIEVMKIATAEMLAKTKIMIEHPSGFDEVNPLCIESSKAIKHHTKKQIKGE